MTNEQSQKPNEQSQKRKQVVLTFDRDLADHEIDQIRQNTDALLARRAVVEAAHHHDVT